MAAPGIDPRAGRVPAVLSVVVVLVAFAARGAINFANITPGGMDAGYYPIQARSLLETGSLLYRDVPLYHWATAGVARGLMALGWSMDSGVLTASKLVDTLVPLGLGVVVLAIGRAFAGGRARAAALAAPVALAVLSGPAMRMVSDFQKQAAAMALLGGAAWACRAALVRGRAGAPAWAGVGVFLALAGMTHAGTFGAAVLTTACVVAAHAAVFARMSPVKLAAVALVAVLGAAALFAGVYFADHGKAMGLVNGLSKLTRFGSDGGGGGPIPMPMPSGGPVRGPGPGPGQGMRVVFGGFGAMGMAIAVVSHVLGIWTLVAAWRARESPAADRATASGCALAAMALASPLLAPDYFMRLTLMAPAPAAIALAFVLTRHARQRWVGCVAWAVLVASVGSAAAPLTFLLRPMVSDAGLAELAAMEPIVHGKPGTVVVARHGLEFWAAYFLHTPVRTGPGRSADLAKFERVLVLLEVGGPGERGPMGMGGPGPRMAPPGDRPDGPPRRRGGDGPMMPMGMPARLGPPVYTGTVFVLAERAPDADTEPLTPSDGSMESRHP